ncbi:MAG TPA: dihydropteroate synthase [Acidimicrobiales bacterium]|nr:dihydropteroate synthase [Acidimicrobiales bacterium]
MTRPLVMGVINVTPDSFSDGGDYLDHEAAITRGHALIADGADVIDVGGESTRPGAEPVPVAEELRRVLAVVEALSPHVRISIDTRKPEVAEAAIAAGATLVNDVSASLYPVAASAGPEVGFVAMHMLGDPRTMQKNPTYRDVVADVRDFLVERAEAARTAGVEEIWVDPGIGFGKTTAHNLSLLKHLNVLVSTGLPVLIGTSRKRFLGSLLAEADRPHPDDSVPADDRVEGSVASAVWAMVQGVRMVRVHDVRATVHAATVVAG